MAKSKDIPVSFVRECFTADFDAGRLFWRERPLKHFPTQREWKIFNSQFAGKETGLAKHKAGYQFVRLTYEGFCSLFTRHRLLWALAYGQWVNEVDHINGIVGDDRLSNLRSATRVESSRNSKLRSDSTTKLRGVSFDKRRQLYRAYIFYDKKQQFLGYYPTAEEASSVFEREAKKIFGEFYREPGDG